MLRLKLVDADTLVSRLARVEHLEEQIVERVRQWIPQEP
jgi:hypothetical protein